MNATPARRAALAVLRDVRSGRLADPSLRRVLDRLPVRDRAWVVELVRGTLRLRGRLDYILAGFTRRPLDSLDGDVLDALRLGAYQLLEMDGVPAYAAVSQSVELIKPHGGARLVNAVLQSVRRSGGEVAIPSFEADPVAYLSTWGSHPRWLVERWVDRFGAANARSIIDANNSRPSLYLRPIGMTRAEALIRLAAAGLDASGVAGSACAIRLDAGPVEAALDAARAIVQDPAAGMVAEYAAAPAAGVVYDMCAAPGGKAVALADACGTSRASPRIVLAGDVSFGRLARVRENLDRTGPLAVSPVVADGRAPPVQSADLVLVDAPCTGTGTFRRHADGRWRVGPADLASLVRLQAELLEAAAQVVRPGGWLVYATCSLEREENDEQIGDFLERHGEYRMDAPETRGSEDDVVNAVDADGRLRVLPHVHGFDGAFAVRMRRRR